MRSGGICNATGRHALSLLLTAFTPGAAFATFGTPSAVADGGAAGSPAPSRVAVPLAPRSPRPLDAREVIVPIPGAERLRIDNPLGNVTIKSWSRTDAMHIVAEKSSASAEALARLRVHFTAWAGGEVSVETRVDMGGRERALPLVASRVDLIVEVPATQEIDAKTFAGDLSASGLRAGARLETTGGRIGVSDVHGRVVTRQLRGGQTVLAVDGDVVLDGVEGLMRLHNIAGARVEARVVDGDIHAGDIRSREVQLSSTTGAVVLLGVLQPHAHYELRSYSGEVRLAPVPASGFKRGGDGATAEFELRVRSAQPVTSTIPLRTLWRQGDRMRAIATAPVVGPHASRAGDRPVVEMSSVLGRVMLTVAQAFEGPAPLPAVSPQTTPPF